MFRMHDWEAKYYERVKLKVKDFDAIFKKHEWIRHVKKNVSQIKDGLFEVSEIIFYFLLNVFLKLKELLWKLLFNTYSF